MSFRAMCLLNIVIVGVIVLIVQFYGSTSCHLVKICWQNSLTLVQTHHEHGIVTTKSLKSLSNKIIRTNDARDYQQNMIKTSLMKNFPRPRHDVPNGFQIATTAYNVCKSQHRQSRETKVRVIFALSTQVIYCPMEKIGTTFWRRVFYMFADRNGLSNYASPYDVPIQTALRNTILFTQSMLTSMLNNNSFSFLFVRDPFSRLLSAYIDKLVAPNPYYWKELGGRAVNMFRLNQRPGHRAHIRSRNLPVASDVTFTEFVKLATYMEKMSSDVDPHIMSINKGCKPCAYRYTYIGRMETFHDDTIFILNKIILNSSVSVMEKQFKHLFLMDTIKDSIESPFIWKKEIVKTISWSKALERIWLKLQMRGIIAMEKLLDLTPERVSTITSKEFIDMAMKAPNESDPDQLKTQKDLVKRKAFASVPTGDIIDYRNEFKLVMNIHRLTYLIGNKICRTL